MKLSRPIAIVIILALIELGISAGITDDRVDYFETHIRPVLVEHCLECHKSDAEEIAGNLSLDSAATTIAGGDSGPAIVAGDPDASPLIEALRYDGLEMPPSGKLPDEVIRHFEKWVTDGAVDPRQGPAVSKKSIQGIDVDAGRKFWAFQPLQNVVVPEGVASGSGVIDSLLSAKRIDAGIKNPALASPGVRLRRLAYDLTGLPPSPELVDEFTADPSVERWQTIVDTYLGSPSFGEHWARMWLDVARYADSNGSDFNATFHDAWRYRDYVIDSYNEDLPFDEFVVEQLAGDLLPFENNAQRTRQVVATGFLALGAKMLSERDKDKLALDIVDEQIDTVGKTFLGMTLGCARCHDHKFDPIATEDYYGLAGIFGSTESVQGEIIRYVSDVIRVPLPVSPELAAADAAHKVKIKQLEERKKRVEKQLKTLRTSSTLQAWLNLGVLVDNADTKQVGTWKVSSLSPSRLGDDYIHNDRRADAISVTYSARLPEPGEYEVRMSYSAAPSRESKVPVSISTADGPVSVFVDQTKKPKLAEVLQPIGRFVFNSNAEVTIGTKGTTGYVIADAIQFVPIAKADAVSPVVADDSELVAKRKAIDAELKELKANAPPSLPTALAVRDAEEPSDCAVRIRGEPHREGPSVPRGFIEVAMTSEPPAMPTDQSGRAELARWIASSDNPLTARVYVNRVWAKLFGAGIVRTPHNFGTLGERPTHPELLDWLARRFLDQNWSTKSIVRDIVLSDAYSASSTASSEAHKLDPENRLLSRAERRTLTAGQLRDSLLRLSGELDRSRTVDPMNGIGKLISQNSGNDASAKSNASENVRTIYMPIVRNELPELLTTFDFADPEVSVGKRSRTNVPSQALFLMNSEFVRSTARSIAASALDEPDAVSAVFSRILSRRPSTEEYGDLADFIAGYEDPAAGLEAICHALLASTEFRVLE